MRRTTRLVGALVVALVSASAVAACGDDADSQAGGGTSAPQETVTTASVAEPQSGGTLRFVTFAETASLSEIRSVFSTLREETLRYIDSFDEAGLEELVPCPEKWWEALRLEACPRSEILRNLASHEWYHTGQLIVLMRARGG